MVREVIRGYKLNWKPQNKKKSRYLTEEYNNGSWKERHIFVMAPQNRKSRNPGTKQRLKTLGYLIRHKITSELLCHICPHVLKVILMKKRLGVFRCCSTKRSWAEHVNNKRNDMHIYNYNQR